MKRIISPGLLSPQIGGKGNENNSVGSEPNQSRCRAILIFPAHTKAHYWLHWWHTNFGLRFWREVLEPDNKSILIALRWSANVNVLCSGNVSQTWKLTFQDSPLRPWPEGKDGFFLFCFLNGWLRRGIIYRIQVMLEINKEETYKVIKCTCITSPAPLLCSHYFLLLSFSEIPIQSDGGHILPGSQQIVLFSLCQPHPHDVQGKPLILWFREKFQVCI